MKFKRIVMAEADAGGGGKQPELPLKNGEPEAKPGAKPDESVALKAELKAKEERLSKLEAEAKKRADEEKKAADQKAIEEGKAKELLAQREKELQGERERLAALEKREKDLAKSIFDSLPDAEKEAAKLLEGKLSTTDYVDYLRARVAANPGAVAPPAGTPGKSAHPRKMRELHPETREVLEQLFADPTTYRVGQHLEVEPTTDGKKFTLNSKRFVQALRARTQLGNTSAWSTEAVDKVFGAGG